MRTKQAASKASTTDEAAISEAPQVAEAAAAPIEQPTADHGTEAAVSEAPQVAETAAAQIDPPATDQGAAPVFTHRITAVPETGFCRSGRRWYREGTDVNHGDFDDEQWEALEAEPMLVVVSL